MMEGVIFIKLTTHVRVLYANLEKSYSGWHYINPADKALAGAIAAWFPSVENG
jgi:hypothetical protein